MAILLWILAAFLVTYGTFAVHRKQRLWGTVLIGVGLLAGPGGVSFFI